MSEQSNSKELTSTELRKSKLLSQKQQLENLLRKQARLNSEILRLRKSIRQSSKKLLKESYDLIDSDVNRHLISVSEQVTATKMNSSESLYEFVSQFSLEVEELSFEYLSEILESNREPF